MMMSIDARDAFVVAMDANPMSARGWSRGAPRGAIMLDTMRDTVRGRTTTKRSHADHRAGPEGDGDA